MQVKGKRWSIGHGVGFFAVQQGQRWGPWDAGDDGTQGEGVWRHGGEEKQSKLPLAAAAVELQQGLNGSLHRFHHRFHHISIHFNLPQHISHHISRRCHQIPSDFIRFHQISWDLMRFKSALGVKKGQKVLSKDEFRAPCRPETSKSGSCSCNISSQRPIEDSAERIAFDIWNRSLESRV